MQIYHILKRDYQQLIEEDFNPETGKILIQDDGNGPYIKKWDASLGSKPTISQADLDAAPTQQDIDDRLDNELEKEFKKTNRPSSFDRALGKTIFLLINQNRDLKNRVAALEGGSSDNPGPISSAQFKTYLKSKME